MSEQGRPTTAITGRCHCGNIAFDLEWRGDPREIPARACSCAFCAKHGGVWTSHPGSRLRVTVLDPDLVTPYQFGTRTATFHVCARCGVTPVVTCEIDGRLYSVVNVNAFENVDAVCLRRAPASFEGEDVDSRIARRKRNWIGDVAFGDAR